MSLGQALEVMLPLPQDPAFWLVYQQSLDNRTSEK